MRDHVVYDQPRSDVPNARSATHPDLTVSHVVKVPILP